jgi:hypothetical protein
MHADSADDDDDDLAEMCNHLTVTRQRLETCGDPELVAQIWQCVSDLTDRVEWLRQRDCSIEIARMTDWAARTCALVK